MPDNESNPKGLLTSPVGELYWASLYRGNKHDESKFTVELRLNASDKAVQEFVKDLHSFEESMRESSGANELVGSLVSFDEDENVYIIKLKRKRDETKPNQNRPIVVDAKNNPLGDKFIPNGSLGRVRFYQSYYPKGFGVDMKKKKFGGTTARLFAVQVLKLAESNLSNEAFDEVEEYEAITNDVPFEASDIDEVDLPG